MEIENIKKPTISETYNQMLNDYRTRTGKEIPIYRRAFVKCIFWAVAGIHNLLWDYAQYQYLQMFIDTCNFQSLLYFGNMKSVQYNNGQKAVLNIQILGATGTIKANTTYKSQDNGLIYRTIKDTEANAITNLTVECLEIGATGNLSIGAVLNLTNPIINLPDTAIVTSIQYEGSDNEDVEHYRSRVKKVYKESPQGGNFVDYYNWATSVSGIIDCLPYVLDSGTITLFIVRDGSGINRTPTGSITPNPFPIWVDGQPVAFTGSGQMLQIAETIEPERPIDAIIKLMPPNYSKYNVVITGVGQYTTSIGQEIKQSLISYMDNKRPNIPILGYNINGATINKNQIINIVDTILQNHNTSFSTLTITNENGDEIITDILGIGCLAVLNTLTINGTVTT